MSAPMSVYITTMCDAVTEGTATITSLHKKTADHVLLLESWSLTTTRIESTLGPTESDDVRAVRKLLRDFTDTISAVAKKLNPTPTTPTTAAASPKVEYQISTEVIGRGSFGVVYKAMNRETNQIVACKELVLHKQDAAQIQSVAREITLMKRFAHPHIVKYLGAKKASDTKLYVFMEFVDGGSVSKVIADFGPLSEKGCSMYVAQALRGLVYLHSMNVVHRDLKGDNLLVDHNGVLKLSDFGTSKEMTSTMAKTVTGTSHFMAPEVIKGTGTKVSADIWSLGCCVTQMLSGKMPFHQYTTPVAAMGYICASETPWEIAPDTASDECRDFIKRCMQPVPEERWSAEQLLKHKWLASAAT